MKSACWSSPSTKWCSTCSETQGQLANAYQALQESHVELEERRRYMEVVLKNVAAGVVSVNAEGNVMTINKSAEAMFGVRPKRSLGLPIAVSCNPPSWMMVDSFVEMYRSDRQSQSGTERSKP